MRTFAVNEILGHRLSSRPLARDLRAYVDNSGEAEPIIDFAGVGFASRSFMDEFYNLFLKDNPCITVNMSRNVSAMLEAVKSTQNGRGDAPEENAEFHTATDFEDMERWFAKMAI